MRWITRKRGSPVPAAGATPITMRLPSRSTPVTSAPTSSRGAGATVRSTNGLAMRIPASGRPAINACRRST